MSIIRHYTIVLAVLILCSSSVLEAGDLFDAPDSYEAGLAGWYLLSADLDGDGDIDLADGSAAVMLNNGDGTFGDSAQYEALNSPYQVAAADFDGDDDLDLVVVHPVLTSNKNIKILVNNGDGTFANGFTYYVHGSPRFVFAGDLNGDNDPDIAAVGYGRDSVAILYGNGDATFGTPAYLTGGKTSLNGADLDDDGEIDLITTNADALPISVFLNNGSGIMYRSSYAGVTGQAGVADLDGDGDFDLVVAGADSISTHFNDGAGSFTAGLRFPAVLSGASVFVPDLNGDGHSDLVLASDDYPYHFSVQINEGSGSFGTSTIYSSGRALTGADFDGDGDIDLAASAGSGNMSVFFNRGDGTLRSAAGYIAGANNPGSSIWAGDLNGDEAIDLVFPNKYQGTDYFSGSVYVLMGEGGGGFADAEIYPAGYSSTAVVGADLDGNESIDLAVANGTGDDISILLNHGDGTFGDSVHFAAGDDPISMIADDLDGDGDNDLAIALYREAAAGVLINDGSATFAPALAYAAGNSPRSICGVDIDHNGSTDLAVACFDAVYVLPNNGDGTFAEAIPCSYSSYAKTVRSGDFDGDGDIDMASGISNGDSVAVFFNNADSTFTPPVVYPADGNFQYFCVTDIDDDGDLDLAGAGMSLTVILNDGSGNFAPPVSYTGGGGSGIVAADIDNDGDNDLASLYYIYQDAARMFVFTNQTYSPDGSCCIGVRGNANADAEDKVNIGDVTYLLDYLFGIPIGPEPVCRDEGNANADAEDKVNIGDVTYLMAYLFGIPLGPPPPACP